MFLRTIAGNILFLCNIVDSLGRRVGGGEGPGEEQVLAEEGENR
jgi:hypothetical protein